MSGHLVGEVVDAMAPGGRLEHLPAAERLALLAIAEKCHTTTRQGSVRISRIQAATGKSLRTTRRVLHKLTDADLIRVVKRGFNNNAGRACAPIYELAAFVPSQVAQTQGGRLCQNEGAFVPNPEAFVPPMDGHLDGSTDGSIDGRRAHARTAQPDRPRRPPTQQMRPTQNQPQPPQLRPLRRCTPPPRRMANRPRRQSCRRRTRQTPMPLLQRQRNPRPRRQLDQMRPQTPTRRPPTPANPHSRMTAPLTTTLPPMSSDDDLCTRCLRRTRLAHDAPPTKTPNAAPTSSTNCNKLQRAAARRALLADTIETWVNGRVRG